MLQIIFLILFLFIFLIYTKSNKENFLIDKLSINFNKDNEILWLSKDLINIIQSKDETLFKKYDYPYYSNSIITSNTIKNGIIFKPNKNCKNLYIGLSNLKNEDKEKMIEDELLDFSFNLLGNNFIKVLEKVEIDEENKYLFQDLDYCNDPNIKKCMKTSNTYQYDDGDMLALVYHNNRIHYLIVTKGMGLLIHISKNTVNLPLSACIINKENDNLLEKYYFTSNDYNIDPDIKWSVELLRKNKYNQRELPDIQSLNRPSESDSEVVEAPDDTNEYKLPSFERAIRITDANIDDNNKLSINSRIFNMTEKVLKSMYSIKVIVYVNNIPESNDKSIVFDIMNNEKNIDVFEIKNANNDIGTFSIDLSKFVNIIYNKKLSVKVVLRRSEHTSDNLNYVSNEFMI